MLSKTSVQASIGWMPCFSAIDASSSFSVPGLKMIFDHLNQPPMKEFGKWGELMKEAAKHNNFYAKISGLGLASKLGANWTADDLQPSIAFALEHFGEDRCCCGGDWPVALLAGSYEKHWDAYKKIITGLLDKNVQEKVFSANANEFYKLTD